MKKDFSNLKRKRNRMPTFVKEALRARHLLKDFEQRPAYQQNDYIGWINRAKRLDTKEKRLMQMLDELDKGGIYMNMIHSASSKHR